MKTSIQADHYQDDLKRESTIEISAN